MANSIATNTFIAAEYAATALEAAVSVENQRNRICGTTGSRQLHLQWNSLTSAAHSASLAVPSGRTLDSAASTFILKAWTRFACPRMAS